MSSALIRQALEFVDPEEHSKLKKRGKKRSRSAGQAVPHPYKSRSGKTNNTTNDNKVDQNIKKLLVLSEPAADPNIVEKIIQRAKKQKPLLENTEVKKGKEKSILFPEEKQSFQDFEKELFCS